MTTEKMGKDITLINKVYICGRQVISGYTEIYERNKDDIKGYKLLL